MKKAVLIQCHTDAEQVNFLLKNLTSRKHEIDIYIHVDAKSTIYENIERGKNIFFTEKRIDARWGTVSQIYATLELLKMTEHKGYDYVSLISGQDFPVKNVDLFCDFLDENKGSCFFDYQALPRPDWKYNGGINRLKYHWFPNLVQRRDFFSKLALKGWIKLLARFFQRDIRSLGVLYGGSQWFTLTGEAVDYLLNTLRNNPDYLRFFNNSFASDEVFFQTFFMNSPYKERMVNDNLRFIRWQEGSGSPITLTNDYFDEIIQSSSFFMRKVDSSLSKELINNILQHTLSN